VNDIGLNYCLGLLSATTSTPVRGLISGWQHAANWVTTRRLWNTVGHAAQQSRTSTETNRITQWPQLQ